MLKRIRQTLAVFFFVCITLLFLDFTGTVHTWLGWMAKIQFLPALLALNVSVVLFLVILTLLFGRIYCSVICPLGVFQDAVSWISGRRKKKKYRFSYSPAVSWLRYGISGIFVISLLAGFSSLVALLAPYSAYGRMAHTLFQPLYKWGNNILAYFAERADSYLFYETEVWLKSLPVFGIAVLTFAVLMVLSWRNGRTYCNTICPMGTVLGFLARFSLCRPVIDTGKCNGCTLCSRQCKAACINPREHKIDYSRCVACMDCIETCKQGAIRYKPVFSRKKAEVSGKSPEAPSSRVDEARRTFLTTATLVAASSLVKAQEKKVDGGLAVIRDKQVPRRSTRLVPPGALSIRNFENHCTACQLCISVCPNEVLRPSGSLMHLMQPEMSYEKGYCRPECTKCSEVCPAGAIRPITLAEKSATLIGHAVWVRKNCVPLTDGVECGNCARHCPTRAIEMIPSVDGDDSSPRIPAVNEWRCIGCGTCENLCPARPFSAIYVEGYQVHRKE